MNFDNYKNGMDQFDINAIHDDEIYKMFEKNQVNKEVHSMKNKLFKNTMRFAAIAAGVVAISSVGAFAYGAISQYTNYNQYQNRHFNSHEYLDDLTNTTQKINKSDENNDFKVTVLDIKGDSLAMYATIQMETLDGSPVIKSTEFDVANNCSANFRSAHLTDGTHTYGLFALNITDENQPSNVVTFELKREYRNTNNEYAPVDFMDVDALNNGNVSLVLNDLRYDVFHIENIEFTYDNLEALQNAATSSNKPVSFSQKHPNITISNISAGNYENFETPCIFVTYHYKTEEDLKTIKSTLRLFNNTTGDIIEQARDDRTGALVPVNENNGEITLAYYEPGNNELGKDLSLYKIIGNFDSTSAVTKGSWKFDVSTNFSKHHEYTPDTTVTLFNGENTVDKIVISDTTFLANLTGAKENSEVLMEKGLPKTTFTLVFSDGSTYDITSYSGGSNIYTKKVSIEHSFKQLIDSSKVVGIYVNDETGCTNYIELNE